MSYTINNKLLIFNKEFTKIVLFKDNDNKFKNIFNEIPLKLENNDTYKESIAKFLKKNNEKENKKYFHIINCIDDDEKNILNIFYFKTNKINDYAINKNFNIFKIKDLKKHKISKNIFWIVEFILFNVDETYSLPLYIDKKVKKC